MTQPASRPLSSALPRYTRALATLRGRKPAPSLRRLAAALAIVASFAPSAAAQSPAASAPTTAVGSTSSQSVSVTVSITAAGLAAAPVAITQSEATSEFSVVAGGSCAANAVYAPGQQCTVNVFFTPSCPGLRTGAVILNSTSGTLLGQALVTGSATGPLLVFNPGEINTVAGSGSWIYHGDGIAANLAQIFLPMGVAEDASGNLFISDANNNRIRRVDAQTQLISTVAGNGTPGFSGDGAAATAAEISAPSGLLLDGAGNLYFVDSGNHCVRRVDATTGFISTIAGTGGVQGYFGDHALATAARLSLPEGLVMDAAGNLFIGDTGNNRVRRVDASSHIITTYAGTGTPQYNGDGMAATAASLSSPWGLAIGPDGSLYIADLDNNRIRKVNPGGTISTVVGDGTRSFNGDGALATAAELNAPAAVALDPAGNLYVADSGNNRVREVTATTGDIATLSGSDGEQFSGDLGPANQATMYGPYALLFDQSGNLLIADMFHNRVREISANLLPLSYPTQKVGKLSLPIPVGVENDGNASLTISSFTYTQSALDAASTTCLVATPLVMDGSCNLGVEFAPTSVGTYIQGTLLVNSNSGNTPATVQLSGEVLSVNPTTISMTSNDNPSLVGDRVLLTASVVSSGSNLGGTVQFLDGSNTLCAASALGSNATATCVVTTFTLGHHNLTAVYSGDPNNAAATTPTAYLEIVNQAATVALSSSNNPAIVTNNIQLSATVSAPTGTPTGSVIFYDGSTVLGTVSLNTSAVATFNTTQLTPGPHSLTASYSGDTTNSRANSNIVTQVISQASTVTTLGTSNATVPVGTALTFTATISVTNGPAPTGTVQFSEGNTSLGSVTVQNGAASLVLSSLAPGAHAIVATYSGDTDDATSSSTALLETVQQIGTTSVLAVNTNPAYAGTTLQFTATVSMAGGATADGPITGQVTFTDGNTTLGTAPLSSSGTAVFNTSTLSVGSHAITATYGANTNYSGSTSAGLSEVINQTATTTSLASSNGSALAGKPVTLTATVTTTTGVPTGLVTFQDGANNLGQATLDIHGVATLTISSLAVGNHNLVAVYAGDSSYNTSTSAPTPQLISLATTAVTLTGPPSPLNAGISATFTATLTSNGIAPTGSITLMDGGNAIASKTVAAAGAFSFPLSTLGVGNHTLTAVYSGDPDNATSTSNSLVETVQQGATAIALTSSASPQTLGQTITLTASVTSISPSLGGTINFYDGSTLLGSATLGTNGSATLSTSSLPFGLHSVTAVYSGDTNHVTSTAPALSERIVQAAPIGLSSSANPATSGAPLVLTVKLVGTGSMVPSGQVTFLDGTSVLGTGTLDGTGTTTLSTSNLSVGSHSITASYPGDTNFAAITSVVLVQGVADATTQIALTVSSNPATFGSAISLRAVVTSNGGLATGPITFTEGTTTLGTGVLDSTGTAILSLSTLAPGVHSIVANYAGDGKAAASVSAPLSLAVRQATSVSVASSANPSPTLSAINLIATVTNAGQDVPGGAITFTDGGTQLGTAMLDATGNATLAVPSLSAGNHSIAVAYAGNTTNFPASSTTLAEAVQLRPTETTLTATTDPTNDQQVTLIGVVRFTGPATPTGTVTFRSTSGVIGSVAVDSTGVATTTITISTSAENVTATYNGNAFYSTSSSPSTVITPEASPQFLLALNPPNMTLQSKQHLAGSLTVTSPGSFTDNMEFGCLGLPFAATCTFSTTQSTLKAGSAMNVQITIDTGDPLGAGAQAANTHRTASTTLLCFLPGALLAGFGLLRSRRRFRFAPLLALLLAVGLMVSATGCSGLQVNGTPAGTYTFQVTARGQNTGVSQSQTMTLTVTK